MTTAASRVTAFLAAWMSRRGNDKRVVHALDGHTYTLSVGDLRELVSAQSHQASTEAIKFSLEAEEGQTWLRLWFDADFGICREEWPEAPDECYIGADPLFKVIK